MVPTGSSTGATDGSGSSTGDPVEPSAVVFLNFEGPVLSSGLQDDSRIDQTADETLAQEYQPYGDAEDEAQLVDLVRDDFTPFDIAVTSVRPESGNYTMVVVSPSNPFSPGVLTFSSGLDCNNANQNSVVAAFFGASTNLPPTSQANLISSVVGLSVGLERTTNEAAEDVMYQFVQGADASFIDACLDLRETVPIQCPVQHELHCDTGQQNAVAELTALFLD